MATVIAIIKAIPAIKALFEQLVAAYIRAEIAGMQSDIRDAIKKAVEAHDQRDLEKAINNPNAGEHSSSTGSELRDHLPGV